MGAQHTPGQWIIKGTSARDDGRLIYSESGYGIGCAWDCNGNPENEANAHLIAAAPDLYEALRELADLFAHEGESSLERFERLAEMFRRDTGFLAPGKDQPMDGPRQPDGAELSEIYDAWFAAKVTRARAALSRIPQAPESDGGTDG